MTSKVLGSKVASDRWLAVDQGRMWEQAEVVGVERDTEAATLRLRLAETSGAFPDRYDLGATTLRLRLAEVPEVLPGQYYLVRLATDAPPGVVEQAYSLCSSPFPPSAELDIAVREVPGGRASPVLARRVEVGDLLQVRGPFGFLTWTERDGGPLGLVGAGTGVAPLASIVRYGAARGLEVPMTLLCSSRDGKDALSGKELERLRRRLGWFSLVHTFTRDPQDNSARYHRRIDADMLADVFEAAPAARRPALYYVAGPGDMVITVRAMLRGLGVADDRIYSEDHA